MKKTFSVLLFWTSMLCFADEVHWDYVGERGPDFWGQLCGEYSLCSEGVHESPVNINTNKTASTASLPLFHYKPYPVSIKNNGHTVQYKYGGGSIVVDGREFQAKQFHFHSLSEHTLDKQHYPIEMHIVHQSEEGKLAVVGVFIEEGSRNTVLDASWKLLPRSSTTRKAEHLTVNLATLLPKDSRVFSYSGSLTTPPCSEGVSWFVLEKPIQMSREQINAFTSLFSNNRRPVQKKNGRQVFASPPN